MAEPTPMPNDGPSMHDLMIERLQARKGFGLEKYQAVLQTWNYRKPFGDLIEELCDAMVYAMQGEIERNQLLGYLRDRGLMTDFHLWRQTMGGREEENPHGL